MQSFDNLIGGGTVEFKMIFSLNIACQAKKSIVVLKFLQCLKSDLIRHIPMVIMDIICLTSNISIKMY